MKKLLALLPLVLVFVLATSRTRAADSPARDSAPPGELFVTHLTNAPFPHPARARGYLQNGEHYPLEKHYRDNRVAFFIPKGFRPSTKVDFVVHFHGWRATLDRALDRFRLVEQFAASERNAILVVPQGPLDAPDSFGGKLEDPDGFQRFMDEVLATLQQRAGFQEAGLGRIVLSGHSGGYHVIAAILDAGGLTPHLGEVYLFDALYGRADKFLAWIEQRKDARLIAIYTKDGGTLKETQKFIGTLRSKEIACVARQEDGTTLEQLRQNRLVFLVSDLGHNEVLAARHNFRDYLATGGLPSRSK